MHAANEFSMQLLYATMLNFKLQPWTGRAQNMTRNVLDCDQSNYSSRIIFSYTFTLEPNTNRIG